MAGFANLGDMYNLSPATMAGLANVSGTAGDSWEAQMKADAVTPEEAAQYAPIGPPSPPKPAPPTSTLDALRYGSGSAIGGHTAPAPVAPGAPPDTTPHAPVESAEDAAIRKARESDQATARAILAGGKGAGGATVTTPAHWQAGSHSVSLNRGMNPGELEPGMTAKDAEAGHELSAADKHLEAAQYRGAADAMYASAHALASQQANERIAQIHADKDRYIAKEHDKLEQMSAATQREVDPDQFWEHKGTAAKIAAALFIGVGQFAAAMGKGDNAALRIVNDAVSENIKAQQANISNANRALDQRQNIYEKNLAAFGDKERATLATKMQYLDQVAAMADGHRVKAGEADAAAAAEEFKAKIFAQRGKYADDFSKLTHTQASETMNEHFVPRQTAAANVGEKGKEDLFIPDLGGYARSKEEAVKIREHGYRTQVIVGALGKAQDIYDQAQKLNPVTDAPKLYELQKQLESIKAQTAVQQTVKEGQGAMSEGDKKVADVANTLLDGSVWRPNASLKLQSRLAETAKVSAQQERGRLGTNLQRGAEVYVRDAHGNVVPRAVLFGSNPAPRNATDNLDDKIQKPEGQVSK
jgi:hypothetical protein